MAAKYYDDFMSRLHSCVEDFLKEFLKREEIKYEFPVSRQIFAKSPKCPGEVIIMNRDLILALEEKYNRSRDARKICTEFTDEVRTALILSLNQTIQLNYNFLLSHTTITSNGLFYISLNRPCVYQEVIKEVLSMTNRYGHNGSRAYSLYLYPHIEQLDTISEFSDSSSESDYTIRSKSGCASRCISMETGRVLMVAKLFYHLYCNRGCTVCVKHKLEEYAPQFVSFLQLEDQIKESPIENPADTSNDDTIPDFITKLSLWADTNKTSSTSSLTVDAGSFLKQYDLYGRNNFPKNINSIKVLNRGILSRVGQLAFNIYKTSKITESITLLLTTQQLMFLTQQALTLTLMAFTSQSGWRRDKNRLHILEIAPVVSINSDDVTVIVDIEEYVDNRVKSMKEACQIKYGDVKPGSQLETIALTMAEAVIKFEMLSTDHHHTLKLMMSDHTGDNSYDGSFVLYNYARLATLEDNYLKGTYPTLPPMSEVDFSLLTEEEEWTLLYSYILLYPSMVEETALLSEPPNIVVTSGLKKLCQFLTKLCHVFSSYYSRVKILMSPEPNLLPLIQARLMLALALKQVLFNGLQLLGISPLNQL